MKPGDTVELVDSCFLWDRRMLKDRRLPSGSRFTVVALSPRGDFVTVTCDRDGAEMSGHVCLFDSAKGGV